MAEARTDPGELISAAVDALVRHRFELPTLVALRRMVGTVHSAVNAAQWQRVCGQLNDGERAALEALLEVDPNTQESRFRGTLPSLRARLTQESESSVGPL